MHQTHAVDVDGPVISVNGTIETLSLPGSHMTSLAENTGIPGTRLSEHILSDYVCHLPEGMYVTNHTAYVLYL